MEKSKWSQSMSVKQENGVKGCYNIMGHVSENARNKGKIYFKKQYAYNVGDSIIIKSARKKVLVKEEEQIK